MPILNPSFEDEGALPGEAAHWTLTAVTSLEEIAGFGTLPEQAWEDFERWFELLAELDSVLTSRAFFAPGTDGFESFTTGWGAGAYLFELPPAQVVPAPFSVDNVEDCESGWSNATFHWSWDGVPAATGTKISGARTRATPGAGRASRHRRRCSTAARRGSRTSRTRGTTRGPCEETTWLKLIGPT
jgi:hypothetical protein